MTKSVKSSSQDEKKSLSHTEKKSLPEKDDRRIRFHSTDERPGTLIIVE
jgi:hypothetical protein